MSLFQQKPPQLSNIGEYSLNHGKTFDEFNQSDTIEEELFDKLKARKQLIA